MITQERIKQLLKYKDGELVWIKKSGIGSHITVGAVAGSLKRIGYMGVCIDKSNYLTHRLIFLYHHGYLPKTVDHIDGDRLNNKINNLSYTENVIDLLTEGLIILPYATQELLKYAAVLGNTFKLKELIQVTDKTPASIYESLKTAIKKGTIL